MKVFEIYCIEPAMKTDSLLCSTMELRMDQVFGAMAQRIFLSLSGKGRAPPME